MYGGEVEAYFAQFHACVGKADVVLDVSPRYYSSRPSTKMELGGRSPARVERLDGVLNSSKLLMHGETMV